MNMMDFKVDQKRCVNCGLCSSECPVLIIDNKTEYPTIKEGKDSNCLKCQHCMVVCPEGAISIWGKDPSESIDANVFIPEPVELENLMQLRRSVRRFKNDNVRKELIHHLASKSLYAPTAQNENSVQFSIVDNRSDMKKLRELVYHQIQKMNDDGVVPKRFAYLGNFAKMWYEKKLDIIFRDAPHLVIASAPKNGTFPVIDASIAMSYFDLLANSNNIGTLWNGFAKNAFEDVASNLKIKIGIPNDHEVVMVLLFGNPAVNYARSIQNYDPAIKTIKL